MIIELKQHFRILICVLLFLNISRTECWSAQTEMTVRTQRNTMVLMKTRSGISSIHSSDGVISTLKCKSILLAKTNEDIDDCNKDLKNPHKEESTSTDQTRIYFDISIEDEKIGRLIFNLGKEEKFCLPKHSENIIKLCKEDLKAIDPRCSYVKCCFKFSPQFVETMPQYRWAHVLDGRGRNAIGKPTERISDPDSLKSCTHNIYGGVYYGLEYDDKFIMGDYDKDDNGDNRSNIACDVTTIYNCQAGVVLTVPLVGAYRGSTSFSIVRVGESPQEWRENLLLNSAVIGWLESGIEVLHAMARQTRAPPMIVASGRI